MALKLMYITNNPAVAEIAENAGVDRIFIDMEYIGKEERQGGLNTVKNHHTIQDIVNIKRVLKKAELLVRINPIHADSKTEIEDVIAAGADVLMLPFFKSVKEVQTFLSLVNGRRKTLLLLETPEAVDVLDCLLEMDGIDGIHIGINDLSLGYGHKFMFEVLADSTIDRIAQKINGKIPFGFGGIASLGNGLLKAEYVIKEHYRIGSTMAILSRSFCNIEKYTDLDEIKTVFECEMNRIRAYEADCERHPETYEENRIITQKIIREIEEK